MIDFGSEPPGPMVSPIGKELDPLRFAGLRAPRPNRWRPGDGV